VELALARVISRGPTAQDVHLDGLARAATQNVRESSRLETPPLIVAITARASTASPVTEHAPAPSISSPPHVQSANQDISDLSACQNALEEPQTFALVMAPAPTR